MHRPELLLYVKAGCPWCYMAEDYLNRHGYRYRSVDVCKDRAAFDELRRVSGQTLAPTLVVDGRVLPDFGLDELEHFLKTNQIEP
jgi:glutaredoxin 3